MSAPVDLRASTHADDAAVWAIMEPVIRAGETWPLPCDWSCEQALRYWFSPEHEPFVACAEGHVQGIYYLRANQGGNGAHVANCGYMTAPAAQGRGIARAMLEHSLRRARERGFRAMQFNLVVSSNQRAVRTWQGHGFDVVGRLPGAFRHPGVGYVDALVMFKVL